LCDPDAKTYSSINMDIFDIYARLWIRYRFSNLHIFEYVFQLSMLMYKKW
jgi:hypothetical protein